MKSVVGKLNSASAKIAIPFPYSKRKDEIEKWNKMSKTQKNFYRVAVLSGIALTAYSAVVSPVVTVIGAAIAAAKYYSKN